MTPLSIEILPTKSQLQYLPELKKSQNKIITEECFKKEQIKFLAMLKIYNNI